MVTDFSPSLRQLAGCASGILNGLFAIGLMVLVGPSDELRQGRLTGACAHDCVAARSCAAPAPTPVSALLMREPRATCNQVADATRLSPETLLGGLGPLP